MKKIISLLVSSFMVLPIIGTTALVYANEGDNSSGSNISSSTENKETEVEDPTKDESTKQRLKERLEKQKLDLKAKISALEQESIKAKCKGAQVIIKKGEDKIKERSTHREQAYERLLSHLTNIIDKLKNQGIDTSELEQEKSVLDGKLDVFRTNLKSYKQSLADLRAMDCASDPTAFKATLLSARTKRETVLQNAKDIRDYVVNTIKPTLQNIKQQLEKKEQ